MASNPSCCRDRVHNHESLGLPKHAPFLDARDLLVGRSAAIHRGEVMGMGAVVHWLDIHSAAVQAGATIVLVGVTIVYVVLTRVMSKAAAKSAEAARASVAEMQQQRRDNVRPVLVVSSAGVTSHYDQQSGASYYSFESHIRNVGVSAALDVEMQISLSGRQGREAAVALTAGEWTTFSVPLGTSEVELRKAVAGTHEHTMSYFDVLGNRYESTVALTVIESDVVFHTKVELGRQEIKYVGTNMQ